VDAVEPEVLWDGGCCRDNRLSDDLAPVDAPGPRGVPEGAGIGEGRRCEGGEVEVALNKGEGGEVRW